MNYSCIVFDTAPTGHTLRLLNFPTILEKGLGKLMQLKSSMGGMLTQVTAMMGGGPESQNLPDQLLGKVEQMLSVSRRPPAAPVGQATDRTHTDACARTSLSRW